MEKIDEPKQQFTGRARRTTRRSVRFFDRLARWLIAVGGIGTIVAVLLVCVYLFSVALPLFFPAHVDPPQNIAIAQPDRAAPMKMGVDDYLALGWTLSAGGRLQAFKTSDGQPIGPPRWIRAADADDSAAMTACAMGVEGKGCVFGFADGSVRFGTINILSTALDPADLPENLRGLRPKESAEYKGGLVFVTPDGEFSKKSVAVELQPPTPPVSNSAIEQIDFSLRSEGPIFCARSADGKVTLNVTTVKHNQATDEDQVTLATHELPLPVGVMTAPLRVFVHGLGDNVFLVWKDGLLVRYDTRELAEPRQVEKVQLLGDGAEVTVVEWLLGKETLIVGDSRGRLRAWFCVQPAPAVETGDGRTLVCGHDLPAADAPVTALASFSDKRMIAAGDAAGRLRLIGVTSERLLAEMPTSSQTPVRALAATAAWANQDAATGGEKNREKDKAKALLADTAQGMTLWRFDPKHPEITVATLLAPVWYENYPRPEHVWQSTGAEDSEPKYGLWPLIFGTLKATFYSLMFGVPLALLAAIFTSEFLHSSSRARIKPVIETMASLPSVVLGFLAGLVVAPAVETIVPAVLASFVTIPLAFLLGAFLWQLLPITKAIEYARWRFACMALLLPVGIAAAFAVGPRVEQAMFEGDIKRWLNHQGGNAWSGWTVLLLPLAAVGAMLIVTRFVHPLLRTWSRGWSRRQAALLDLAKLVLGLLLTVALAFASGYVLDVVFSLDPRGVDNQSNWAMVGAYVQRNALVVGFMMGFAIIPIIYTLADDALHTVPAHLRSASLAAGATPWQTLMRIVVPTAMSGLFSAVMIGLGRAVGETMIVLMATGGTPVMQWNIFNGFRTLATCIAVEMSEPPPGSTHYRTLFLAGLALFAMTFAVNTAAEIIRQRFRRRAYEL